MCELIVFFLTVFMTSVRKNVQVEMGNFFQTSERSERVGNSWASKPSIFMNTSLVKTVKNSVFWFTFVKSLWIMTNPAPTPQPHTSYDASLATSIPIEPPLPYQLSYTAPITAPWTILCSHYRLAYWPYLQCVLPRKTVLPSLPNLFTYPVAECGTLALP